MNDRKNQTKKDQIVTALRDLIATGEIPRGARMQQDELALHFSVSTTPVREALRQLEAEGLVVSEPHRGVRVASVDLGELEGIYILRRLVEPYAMCRASVLMSRLDLQHAEALLVEMEAASKRHEHDKVRTANHDFHFLIYERTGVPSLVKLIRQLWASYPWDILQVVRSRPPRSLSEHAEILAALSSGDLPRIREAAEAHIHTAYVAVVEHLTHELLKDDPYDLGAG
jgi:DNA-binding GntR family transcriptional regulator